MFSNQLSHSRVYCKSLTGPFLTIACLQKKRHSFLVMNEMMPSKKLWLTLNEKIPMTAYEVLQYTVYVIQYMHAWVWLPVRVANISCISEGSVFILPPHSHRSACLLCCFWGLRWVVQTPDSPGKSHYLRWHPKRFCLFLHSRGPMLLLSDKIYRWIDYHDMQFTVELDAIAACFRSITDS